MSNVEAPRVAVLDRLDESTDGLRLRAPELSASTTLSHAQRIGSVLAVLALVACAVAQPKLTALALVALATIIYTVSIGYRALLYWRSVTRPSVIRVSDTEALAVPEADLPIYTILIPAFREPDVVAPLFRALEQIDYPREKLEVRLLLEADDVPTRAAATAAAPPSFVEIVAVPPADPRTKPKALNYGIHGARGDIICIYDIEDEPDRLQLRRAAVALAAQPIEIACLQGQLAFRNTDQNVITRWFTLEYHLWFTQYLPGLVATGAPVPLGGTSNHFRRAALADAGAWDPYNVTEDADLGLRLHRAGYRTLVLESVTLEEANTDFVNWVKQRSRWLKGYLQTWAVHMRHPKRLWDQLGPSAFVEFNMFVGGTPILALLNPIFWAMTLMWLVARPAFVQAMFVGPIYYLSLLTWLGGNFVLMFLWFMAAEELDRPRLRRAAATVPVYWVMMSIAAVKALVQLVVDPSYWEKTTHGLEQSGGSPPLVSEGSEHAVPTGTVGDG